MKKISRTDLEMKADLLWSKYAILRRTICYGKPLRGEKERDYTISELTRLCCEIEGKSVSKIGEIHKQWIGY